VIAPILISIIIEIVLLELDMDALFNSASHNWRIKGRHFGIIIAIRNYRVRHFRC